MQFCATSEVLESAFGKLKSLCGEHQTGGFTSLLLSICGRVGRLDGETIYDALVAIPWKHVGHWVANNLGQTHQSKRCLAYQDPRDEIALEPA